MVLLDAVWLPPRADMKAAHLNKTNRKGSLHCNFRFQNNYCIYVFVFLCFLLWNRVCSISCNPPPCCQARGEWLPRLVWLAGLVVCFFLFREPQGRCHTPFFSFRMTLLNVFYFILIFFMFVWPHFVSSICWPSRMVPKLTIKSTKNKSHGPLGHGIPPTKKTMLLKIFHFFADGRHA